MAASQNALFSQASSSLCTDAPSPQKNYPPIFSERRGASVYRLASSPSVEMMDLGSVFCPLTSTVISNYLSFQLRKD